MSPEMIEMVGSIAGIITTGASLPQVIQIYKTNDISGLSLAYFNILLSGILLWLWYGYLLNSITLMIPNLITAILLGMIIYKIVDVRFLKTDQPN